MNVQQKAARTQAEKRAVEDVYYGCPMHVRM